MQCEVKISKKKKLQRNTTSYNVVTCSTASCNAMFVALTPAITTKLMLQHYHSCRLPHCRLPCRIAYWCNWRMFNVLVVVWLTSQSTSIELLSIFRRISIRHSFQVLPDGSSIPFEDNSVPSNGSPVPSDNNSVPSNKSPILLDDSFVPSNDNYVPFDGNFVPFNVHRHPFVWFHPSIDVRSKTSIHHSFPSSYRIS